MKNPWAKKNPFLSMWLSGANALAGSARARTVAEGRRQAASAMTRNTRQMTEFWTDAMTGAFLAPPPKRKKRRR